MTKAEKNMGVLIEMKVRERELFCHLILGLILKKGHLSRKQ